MKTKLYLGALAVLAFGVAGYVFMLEPNVTKIDDEVSLVTLQEHILVIGPHGNMRLTRVKPERVEPERIEPPARKTVRERVRERRERDDPKQTTKPPAAKPATPAAPKQWTLPYSCSDVKYYGSHFSKDQLEAMRKAANMPMPTASQRAQIQACLAGELK